MSAGKPTSTKSRAMGAMFLACAVDAVLNANVEPYKRLFGPPKYDVKRGAIEVQTIRKRSDGKLEKVTWRMEVMATQLRTEPVEAPHV